MNEASEGGRRTGAGGERLVLLGRFELFTGSGDVVLPKGAQRLLAFLAIHHGDAVSRQAAAEQLWPGCRRQRANANVRQALWHLRRATDRPVVEPSVDRLRLSPALTVDFCRAVEAAHLVVGPSAPVGPRVADGLVEALSQDLLPYWAEEWLAPERRRWEQVRLHALEAIAQRFISAGAHLAALEAAFTAIAIDPVRETAHRTVVAAHLAQGNCGSALRHYQQYRALLHRELGVAPSAQMTRLVASQAAM